MKIIGITEVDTAYTHIKSGAYIAIITHDEMEKVANKAGYGARDETIKKLKVGADYNISEGHDFRTELTAAIKAMEDAYTKFAKVAHLAGEFAAVVRSKEGGPA